MGDEVRKQVKAVGLSHINWVDSDVFHQASLHGHLHRIVKAVNTRKVVMVGPPQLRGVTANKTLPLRYWAFVDVPPKNAYLDIKGVIANIQYILGRYDENEEPLLISVSASLPAGIILHKIYPLTKGRHTAIDFGALWDPLVGIATSGYHKKEGVKALVSARNTNPYVTEAMKE